MLTFLGILIDTHKFELCMPLEKLTNLVKLIHMWTDTNSCTKKELESPLGHLSHAATVIPQGCTFLCSLFSLLLHAYAPHHILHLNLWTRADIKWWATFLNDWNGKSLFPASKSHDFRSMVVGASQSHMASFRSSGQTFETIHSSLQKS